MVSRWTQIRYHMAKAYYTLSLTVKEITKIEKGCPAKFKHDESSDFFRKEFFNGRMTFLHWNKEEMAPLISGNGVTLLVRSIPLPDRLEVNEGDVVLLKNPEKPDDYLVRRLAATDGYEMVSTDEKEESFVLKKDQCWVVADNKKLKPMEAIDSRTFGPVHMNKIVGRVLYCMRSAVDHNRVLNSKESMFFDSPVLEMEHDVDEMAKSHKASEHQF